jgi:hypothetical protein
LEFRNLAKTEVAKLAAKDRQDAARTEIRKSVRLAQAGRPANLASEGQAIQRQRHSASNARVKVAQAETPNSSEPVKVDHPVDEQRKQRQTSSTAFVDAVGSVSSGDLEGLNSPAMARKRGAGVLAAAGCCPRPGRRRAHQWPSYSSCRLRPESDRDTALPRNDAKGHKPS